VGAYQSRGGVFGTLGIPGSCAHRLGHYPVRAVYLSGLDSGRNFTRHQQPNRGRNRGLGKAFLEYTEEDVAYGPVVRDQASTKGLSELAMFEARYAQIAAKTPGSSGVFVSKGLVPGPFVDDTDKRSGSPFLTSLRHVAESPPNYPVRDADGHLVRESRNFRLGLSFSELCAPVYYFIRTGILILRIHEAWSRTADMGLKLELGACAPLLKRDKANLNSTCSDARRISHESAQDSRVSSLLYPQKGLCDCGPAFVLEPRSFPLEDTNSSSQKH
jgi:hypothetical protein